MNPNPKRPIGILVATIALTLAALLNLLITLSTASAAVLSRRPDFLAHQPPGAAMPPPGFLTAILVGVTIFFLLISVWIVTTTIGIFRLRNWARYSVLILGGLLAFFGLVSAAIIPAMSAAPSQPAISPTVMHGMFAILALFYLAIAAIGIWWLVYFNLRSTKTYFLPGYAQDDDYTAQTRAPYPYPSAASLATPGGLPLPPPPIPVLTAPKAPTAIVIIACLFFILALCCAVMTFLPFPGFFLGVILTGAPDHILYAILTLLTATLGLGLLRLDNRARLATYALLALATLNLFLAMTPWFRARSLVYQATIRNIMHVPNAPSPIDPNSLALLIPSILLSLAIYATIAWLLHRHRAAFTQ